MPRQPRHHQHLSRAQQIEIERLQMALVRVMRPEFVARWLQSPNPALDGLKPSELIDQGQMERLWQMISRLESGHPG